MVSTITSPDIPRVTADSMLLLSAHTGYNSVMPICRLFDTERRELTCRWVHQRRNGASFAR